MIDLTHHRPFASGFNRHCYIHPDNPGLCLKVVRRDHLEQRYQRQPTAKKLLGRQRLDDNRQEQHAHRQAALAAPDSPAWQLIPAFYGSVPTTLGQANVSELIVNDDGSPACTLEHVLKAAPSSTPVQSAIDEFCLRLTQTGLLTRNLLPHNLVVQRTDAGLRLVLVDGLGAPTLAALLAGNAAYRRRYIERKIRRFHLRIDWECRGRPGSWEQAQKL